MGEPTHEHQQARLSNPPKRHRRSEGHTRRGRALEGGSPKFTARHAAGHVGEESRPDEGWKVALIPELRDRRGESEGLIASAEAVCMNRNGNHREFGKKHGSGA